MLVKGSFATDRYYALYKHTHTQTWIATHKTLVVVKCNSNTSAPARPTAVGNMQHQRGYTSHGMTGRHDSVTGRFVLPVMCTHLAAILEWTTGLTFSALKIIFMACNKIFLQYIEASCPVNYKLTKVHPKILNKIVDIIDKRFKRRKRETVVKVLRQLVSLGHRTWDTKLLAAVAVMQFYPRLVRLGLCVKVVLC